MVKAWLPALIICLIICIGLAGCDASRTAEDCPAHHQYYLFRLPLDGSAADLVFRSGKLAFNEVGYKLHGLTPDGLHVVYSSNWSTVASIDTLFAFSTSDSSRTELLIGAFENVALSPRGDRYAYVVADADPAPQLRVRSIGERREKFVAQGTKPRWLSGGDHLAFLWDGALAVVNVNTLERFTLLQGTIPSDVLSYDVSPDASALVYHLGHDGEAADPIYRMAAGRPPGVRVAYGQRPQFIPGTEDVIYVGTGLRLQIARRGESSGEPLEGAGTLRRLQYWLSPTGALVAFPTGDHELSVADLRTNGVRRFETPWLEIPQAANLTYDVSWAPDESALYLMMTGVYHPPYPCN